MTTHWTDDAACREVGWTIFVPPEEHGAAARAAADYRLARPICGGCPVRVECLEYAMQAEGGDNHGDRAGLWGGLTPQERYQLHLDRTTTTAAA